MSEVKRFDIEGRDWDLIEGRDWVSSENFDLVISERDALQQRLTNAEKRAGGLEGLLREVMECPQVVESATIPRAGIESAPHNVVVTIHIALLRLRKVQAALKPVEGEGS